MKQISRQFKLRPAQERAFCIIANHAVHPNPDQLKMYLGGMAGTGKSQVIKALTAFFDNRGEEHRIQLAAPTGAAAAIIGGSTYHSLLGITGRDKRKGSLASIAKVKSRLIGTDYLFIDEVSMVGCKEMDDISKRLALIMDREAVPFGGVNIIVAGDFAQLPPVGAQAPLYSGNVGSKHARGSTTREQETILGKSIRHQFTTVVLLRENMRQLTQTDNDSRFRRCLENMRYGKCT